MRHFGEKDGTPMPLPFADRSQKPPRALDCTVEIAPWNCPRRAVRLAGGGHRGREGTSRIDKRGRVRTHQQYAGGADLEESILGNALLHNAPHLCSLARRALTPRTGRACSVR